MMLHGQKRELMDSMNDTLRVLDDTKLISPEDLEIVTLKRTLRNKVAQLECEAAFEDLPNAV
jgi:hypothetical protein